MANVRFVTNCVVRDFDSFAKHNTDDNVIVVFGKDLITELEKEIQGMADNEELKFDSEDGSLVSDSFSGESVKELFEALFDIHEEEKDWTAEVTLRTSAFTKEEATKIFEAAIDNLCDISEASLEEVRED